MTEHITGHQARELLDGTTPGPWEWRHNDYPEHDEAHDALGNGDKVALRSQDAEQYASWVSGSEQDRALAAAAPALAATVAWLYGREPDKGKTHEFDTEYVGWVPGMPRVSVYVARDHGESHADLTPDEAVDLARALLAAAEKARRHTD